MSSMRSACSLRTFPRPTKTQVLTLSKILSVTALWTMTNGAVILQRSKTCGKVTLAQEIRLSCAFFFFLVAIEAQPLRMENDLPSCVEVSFPCNCIWDSRYIAEPGTITKDFVFLTNGIFRSHYLRRAQPL